VSGSELRDRLGSAADLVLSVSYLDHAERERLFSSASPRASAPVEADDRPAPPPPADGGERPRTRTRDEIVRIGGSVSVAEDEVVSGDVVAIGGSVAVRGEVRGEVVAVGGAVDLGPRAVVTGDVTVVGGTLTRETGAVVRGEVREVSLGGLTFDGWRRRSRDHEGWSGAPGWTWRTPSALERLIGTLVRFAMYCLLAAIVVLVGRDHVDRVGRLAAAESLKAGAIGLFSQLLFVPLLVIAIIVLLITIIGIPFIALIPFGVVALVIIAFIGFTGVAHVIGRTFGARFGLTTSDPYVTTFTGVLIILAPILLSRIVAVAIGGLAYPMTFVLSMVGSVGEYLAWTVGFGAMALAKFSQVRTTPGGPV
jgi:hypothetical protein